MIKCKGYKRKNGVYTLFLFSSFILSKNFKRIWQKIYELNTFFILLSFFGCHDTILNHFFVLKCNARFYASVIYELLQSSLKATI